MTALNGQREGQGKEVHGTFQSMKTPNYATLPNSTHGQILPSQVVIWKSVKGAMGEKGKKNREEKVWGPEDVLPQPRINLTAH